jgi:hypothetical protein
MRVDRAEAFLNRPGGSSPEALAYFSPQPSPEAAFARFLEWLGRGGYETDVPLLTPQTQRYMASLPMTRGYNDFILMSEYGQAYRVDTRGELAMLYFTSNPLLSPHLLRRTSEGWTIDVFAELRNTRNYSGYWYTWGLVESGDDFATTFADRYLDMSGVLRVAGGDNRPLPAKAFPDVTLWPAPHPEDSLVRVTVEEAAARIAAAPGRSVIMLYPQSSALELAKIAERCRAAGAQRRARRRDAASRRAGRHVMGAPDRGRARRCQRCPGADRGDSRARERIGRPGRGLRALTERVMAGGGGVRGAVIPSAARDLAEPRSNPVRRSLTALGMTA